MARGRPRAFCEEAVLDTAVRLFLRDGYHGVGIAEICREAGVSPQSLYNAFGDKAALYQRAMDRYGRLANDRMIEALDQTQDAEQALRGFVRLWRRHIAAGDDGGCLFAQALVSARGEGPCDGAVARAYTVRLRRALRARARELATASGHTEQEGDTVVDGLLTLAIGSAALGRGGLPAVVITRAMASGQAMIDRIAMAPSTAVARSRTD